MTLGNVSWSSVNILKCFPFINCSVSFHCTLHYADLTIAKYSPLSLAYLGSNSFSWYQGGSFRTKLTPWNTFTLPLKFKIDAEWCDFLVYNRCGSRRSLCYQSYSMVRALEDCHKTHELSWMSVCHKPLIHDVAWLINVMFREFKIHSSSNRWDLMNWNKV